MRIVDRYIFRSIVTTFLATIFIFLFLYILIDIASNLNEIIERKVSAEILLQYYLSFLPIITVQTSPIACLIAILLTFGHLSQNNELIVLRTAGLNFWKITKPALIFAAVVCVFIFWVNERFVPQANMTSNEIRDNNIILEADKQRKKSKISNLTFYGLKNRLYFIDLFDPNASEIERVTIIGQDENQNPIEKIVALKGKWTGIAWKFYQCQITTFHPEDPSVTEDVQFYDEKLMDIKETPKDFLHQKLDINSMNMRELHDYIKRFEHSGAAKALNNLRVDLHQKIAFPFGNIAIILVGLPLAMVTGRRKALTFSSLGVAMAIGFFFYVLNAVGLALGKGGLFSPILAAWLAPLIFLLLAIYLIKTKF